MVKEPRSGLGLLTIALAIIAAALTAFIVTEYKINKIPTEEESIKEFYDTETAVHVSPHHLRKAIMKGETNDFILVDLRSREEYLKGHIIGAINIPAYKDKDHSDYGAVERIVNSFRELKEKNPEKDIIVYCYSLPCMTGRKVGKILAENGIYVKHLGIGWNEWRYFWKLWNHPHEWNLTNVSQYIATGAKPGVFNGTNYLKTNQTISCPVKGELGC